MASSKFNLCVKLAKYILADDDCPKEFLHEPTGDFVIPKYEPPPGAKRTDKIVVYQEFISHSAHLKKVCLLSSFRPGIRPNFVQLFELNGIDCMLLNGTMSLKARQANVEKFFQDDTGPRVLIMSKVGMTGLNLSRANHMIFMVRRHH
jgi:hypothetical protein